MRAMVAMTIAAFADALRRFFDFFARLTRAVMVVFSTRAIFLTLAKPVNSDERHKSDPQKKRDEQGNSLIVRRVMFCALNEVVHDQVF